MRASSPLPRVRNTREHQEIIDHLPDDWEVWPEAPGSLNCDITALKTSLSGGRKRTKLKFPKRRIVFISDPHADAEAFEASLIASGAVRRTHPGLCNLKLTKEGKDAEIIVGGDCLDKGPSNLALLRSLKHLMQIDARLTLLAGNHDLRLLMGLLSLRRETDTGNQHLFVRMGKKVIPLFKEVFTNYLANTNWEKQVPSEQRCREALFPDEHWFEDFPYHAAGILTAEGIDREVRKMRSKTETFEYHCAEAGLTLQQVYATALKCEQLFIHKKGEFRWFFETMKLVQQRGSFLFLHAGLDDQMCQLIAKSGIKYANRAFNRNLKRQDLFSFYYSPIANTFRTKYRKADLPLTETGVRTVHKAGIRVLVHGHINRNKGQRLAVKQGLMHVEADITLDAHSRSNEGLSGPGMGATLIDKKFGIIGISSDYPKAKVFHPDQLNSL